jgi:hypothetical protein
MYRRVSEGKPPVTEAEWWKLAAWYRKHESEGIHDPGISYALFNTYSGGPRRLGATTVVMKLRRLRAAHPELADDHLIPDPSASEDRRLLRREGTVVPDGDSLHRFPRSCEEALPEPTGLDNPERLDAFLDAVPWGAASSADDPALEPNPIGDSQGHRFQRADREVASVASSSQ